ncbi:DEAD-box ATP-dependent RNA helicase 47, mitochondrial [Vitis vinifera]|uniref:RNA helicase n=1 Tax=Vitis vinifera TaxID=29760 RepID=A0A438BZQ0_VITVI|nr:DEAD-box ATP-dependent RNA helicase 47, mitochondrial [Vitis vinifera]
MQALASTRLLLLVGDCLPVGKLLHVSRFHGSVRFLSRVDREHGPLTLASLGFKSEFETTKGNKTKPLHQLNAVPEVSKNKVKAVRSNEMKAVGTKKSIEIEAAPFAAKSFSELGLPPLLIDRLEREGFSVPTDVQSAAIPTILKNHDVVIQSYTGSGKTLAYLLPILSEVGPLKNKPPMLTTHLGIKWR